MVSRNIGLEMDIADSSSESGLAESVTDDDQHIDDNSLMCNPTAGNEVQGDIGESVAVIYPNIEYGFKAEWTDVYRVPLSLVASQFHEQIDITGPVHTWRGVDWSILFRLQLGAVNLVGAYFGYDEQPYYLNEISLRVHYQLQLVDENDVVVVEGMYARLCEIVLFAPQIDFLILSCHCRKR